VMQFRAPGEAFLGEMLRDELVKLGHVEGRTLRFEFRHAHGDNKRFSQMAKELLRLKPAVIFSPCGPAQRAIRELSRTVPVFSMCADPNNFLGEVRSLKRPGGATTGFTQLAPESAGKRFQFLLELRPGLKRVAVLQNKVDDWGSYYGEMERVAPSLGLTLLRLPMIESAADLEGAFAEAVRLRAEAVVVLPDATTIDAFAQIGAIALRHGMLSAFDFPINEAGGLMSYGPVFGDLMQHSAGHIDRILKGTPAGELPIIQPTRFQLIVNIRTARAMGITVPRSLLLRADRVIEMNRRELLRTLAATALVNVTDRAHSQPVAPVRRIALLDDGDREGRAHVWKSFHQRLEELGFAEGRNLTVERRWADNVQERLPQLAESLLAAKPELVVTNSTSTTRAMMKLTSAIPIVFTNVGNPIGSGLVASLARPGGNVTGLSILGAETHAKRLELLSEVLPRARRFGFIGPLANRSIVASYEQLQRAAKARKLEVRMLDAGDGEAVKRAFASFASERIDGLVVASMLLPQRALITELAARHKVPAIYVYKDFLDVGGLIAFGPDLELLYRRTADYVHRILRGAKPAELPVEQPVTLSLGVNLRAAKGLGLAIPQSVLIRADRVIE